MRITPFDQAEQEAWRDFWRSLWIGVASVLLLIGGRAIHSGFMCAAGYAGFPVATLALALKSAIRTGAMLTAWRAYHRTREPVRYWLGVVLLAAGVTLFVVAGMLVILRDGLNGFIPHPGGLISAVRSG